MARSISFNGDTSVLPCPTHSKLGFNNRSLAALSAARAAFHENQAGKGNTTLKTPAATKPACVVNESPAISELSRTSQKAMCPGVCPGQLIA